MKYFFNLHLCYFPLVARWLKHITQTKEKETVANIIRIISCLFYWSTLNGMDFGSWCSIQWPLLPNFGKTFRWKLILQVWDLSTIGHIFERYVLVFIESACGPRFLPLSPIGPFETLLEELFSLYSLDESMEQGVWIYFYLA